MSRDRSLLHLSKLDAFRQFCESRGWRNDPIKGDYERLRMTKAGCPVLIVYAKLHAKEHCTVHGIAHDMARAFIGQQRATTDRSTVQTPTGISL